MKGRLWVLLLLFVLVAGVAGYTGLFRIFSINERVEAFITDMVSERMGVTFTSQSLSILPWSIRLNEVRIESSSMPVTVTIKRIRLRYNLISLLLNDLQPLLSTSELYVDEPVLTWHRWSGADDSGSFSLENRTLTFERVPSVRINLVNGAMLVAGGDSTLVVAEKVSGWIDGYRNDEVAINIQGAVLADSLNMTCRGSLDKLDRRLTLDLESTGCNLAAQNNELISGDIAPASGALDVSVHAEVADGALTLDGSYRLTDGSFRLKTLDIGVSDFAVEGYLNEREIGFDTVTGSIWGMTPRLSGHVLLQPEPTLELAANAGQVDIAQSLAYLLPDTEELPDGVMDFGATVSGPLRDLSATVQVTADSLVWRSMRLDSLAVAARIAGDTMTLDSASAISAGYRIVTEGRLRQLYQPDERPFSLTASLTPLAPDGYATSIACRGIADVAGQVYDTSVDLRMDALPGPVAGTLRYDNHTVTYSLADSSVSLEGEITGLPEDIVIDSSIMLDRMPIFTYAGQPDRGLVLDGSLAVTGTPDSLAVETGVRVIWGENLNSMLSGAFAVADPFGDERSAQFDGRLIDHHLRFSPALTWDVWMEGDHERIAGGITDPDGAELVLGADVSSGELDGRLSLDAFPLEWIVAIFVREEFSHRGDLYGSVDIGGTIREPVFNSPYPLRVTDMTLAGLHRLEGAVSISGSTNDLRFADVRVSRKGMPVLSANGVWENGSPFILEASGDGLELSAIDDVISDTRRTDGTATFDVRMEFTRRHGTVTGSFTLEDGHFYDIPIGRASGTFGGGSDGFVVEDFTVERQGVYSGYGRAESGYFWRDKTETPGLNMRLTVEGDLIRALPTLTGALNDATGDCRADLTIGGTWQEPIALGGELYVENGTIKPAFLIDEVTDISALLRIDPDTPTPEGLRAVRVVEGRGQIGDRQLEVTSLHQADDGWDEIARPGLRTIPNEDINLDFGVLRGSFPGERNRDRTLKLHVPGFMEDGETGVFELAGRDDALFTVGASDDGEKLTPYIAGHVTVMSGDINYPLVLADEDEANQPDTGFLEEIFWDLLITAGSNVNYVKEYNLEIGSFAGTTLWQNEIRIDENSSFEVFGRLADGSFRVTGTARSTTGFVSYYGYRFDIDFAELELDTANELKPAILTGRARTIVYDDTLGTENDIYLHVDFVDRESGRVTEARGDLSLNDADYEGQNRPQTRFDAGPLGIIEIRFSSSNPTDDSQELILAKLGISPGNFGAAATRALTAGIDNYYFNPLLRPFEEKIKHMFRLDMVKITPSIFGTFAQQNISGTGDVELGTDTFFVDRSRIMLGEYILRDWFVSYTGQYGVGRDFLFRKERGFYHDIGLQYTIERNLRFQGRYIYDEIINKDDARVEFRYDFSFD